MNRQFSVGNLLEIQSSWIIIDEFSGKIFLYINIKERNDDFFFCLFTILESSNNWIWRQKIVVKYNSSFNIYIIKTIKGYIIKNKLLLFVNGLNLAEDPPSIFNSLQYQYGWSFFFFFFSFQLILFFKKNKTFFGSYR